MDIHRQKKIFDKQAEKYSKLVRKQTPDQKWRQRLLRAASGRILEVSAGAGTNFRYYSRDASITAVDFSPAMIEKAKEVARESGKDVDFLLANVEELDLPEGTYDTVVSTLSICAYPNPEKVLNLLSKWCKKGGQVLLLEHGLSSNPILSKLQYIFDPIIEKRTGCHINRDIIQLIEGSLLDVDHIERSLLGTVHLVWAKPGD